MPTITTELSEPVAVQTPPDGIPSFLELEITGFCQLKCVHCYAESGPHGGRGAMTTEDWERVIEPFSSSDFPGLKNVDRLGQLTGAPGAPAELAQDAPGLVLWRASEGALDRVPAGVNTPTGSGGHPRFRPHGGRLGGGMCHARWMSATSMSIRSRVRPSWARAAARTAARTALAAVSAGMS